MKNIFALCLAVLLLLLTACGDQMPTTSVNGTQFYNPTQNIIHSSQSTTGPKPTQTIPLPTEPEPTTPVIPPMEGVWVKYTPWTPEQGGTYTGLPSLEPLEYYLSDPWNTKQLSENRIDFCFGAASGGEPHFLTKENQERFRVWGTEALAWDSISEEKVLYLTFDCGYEYGNITSQVLDILEEKQIQTTFFCTLSYLRSAPQVVARMILEGHNVANHSMSHPEDMTALSREKMVLEALAVENFLRVNFGYSAKYFRFPNGVYSENAVDLMDGMGYRSVFWSIAYADWDPEAQCGEEAAFQILTERLHPGAVILLHTTSADNAAILSRFIDYAIAEGYTFQSLDDYPGWNSDSQQS